MPTLMIFPMHDPLSSAGNIESSVLRRFDYSLEFDTKTNQAGPRLIDSLMHISGLNQVMDTDQVNNLFVLNGYGDLSWRVLGKAPVVEFTDDIFFEYPIQRNCAFTEHPKLWSRAKGFACQQLQDGFGRV